LNIIVQSPPVPQVLLLQWLTTLIKESKQTILSWDIDKGRLLFLLLLLFLPYVEEVVVVAVVVTVEAVLEAEAIQTLEDRGLLTPENAMFVIKKAIIWPTALRFKLFRTSCNLPPGRIAIINFRV
jgi:hypothetical protein